MTLRARLIHPVLIALRLATFGHSDSATPPVTLAAGPVVSEHTDGHSYQLAVSAATKEACFSGDPDIDAVVAAHKRPLVMGAGI